MQAHEGERLDMPTAQNQVICDALCLTVPPGMYGVTFLHFVFIASLSSS